MRSDQGRIITIPNLMSAFRILLIPVIAWAYLAQCNYTLAAILLALSGLTDILDGLIARQFRMVSTLGKVLDPVADKLTQGVILICLAAHFPALRLVILVFLVKEALVGSAALYMLSKGNEIYGAQWHGKVNTVLLYLLIALHILWPTVPAALSWSCAAVALASMLLSMSIYLYKNLRLARKR